MTFKKIAMLFLTALFLIPCTQATAAVTKPNATPRQVLKATGQLHVPFVENRGQAADPAVAYVADIFACQVAVTCNGEIIYSQPSQKEGAAAALKIKERLVGPAVKIDVTGLEKQSAKVGYYQGRDPAKWQANLPTYARAALGRTAPGIRVELRAHGRNVEKLFYLEPGADPSHIRLAVEGAHHLSVGADGALELSTPSGESMRFTKPVAYQERNGQRRMVPVRYRVRENSYGFDLGPYDRSRGLVIDPLVEVFSVKAEWDNAILDVAADAQGNVYAAGYSNSRLAIWKLDSRLENLLASVYFSSLGNFLTDTIRSIALDSQGNVFVAGYVSRSDFPVIPGCHDAKGDRTSIIDEGFVTKFSADLVMLASTFIGGDHIDRLFAMVISDRDQIYVAGYSTASALEDYQDFPVTDGAFDTVPGPDYQKKAVVARLDNDLSTVEAATFLGGIANKALPREKENAAYCLAIDARGDVWVAGPTLQSDFPVTDGCGDATYNGDGDVFLSKFDSDLQHLLLSTYLGANQDEAPTDMLLDGQGNVYLSGYTRSGNFPIPDSGYDTSHSLVEEDGFIVKISPRADKKLAGTFLGGTDSVQNEEGDDVPDAMALTADDKELVVVGRTESQSFPTTPGCLDNTNALLHNARPNRDTTADIDQGDGFVTTLSSDLTRLIHSTFVGGDDVEYLDTVMLNGDDIIVGGETQSSPAPSGGFPFPLDNPDDETRGDMAILMRFTDNETPNDPANQNDTNDVTIGSGGGGGRGCFIGSISLQYSTRLSVSYFV